MDSDFESILASVLQLAKVTYIEIPTVPLLNLVSFFYGANEEETPYDSFSTLFESVYSLSVLFQS